jgi:hypothetical protein
VSGTPDGAVGLFSVVSGRRQFGHDPHANSDSVDRDAHSPGFAGFHAFSPIHWTSAG